MITSSDILQTLFVKHSGDVFIAECKSGPSQCTTHLRMDAWVMKKSWSRPLTTAYEIKVSRSDFLRDEKWRGYLDFCNEFYFVCPGGVIRPEETPAEAGLKYCSDSGNVIYTKKRAPYRKVEIPEKLYRYILMARTRIDQESHTENTRNFWERWVKQKEQDVNFGHMVGKRIKGVIKARIHNVEEANRDLNRRIEKYDEIKRIIERLGFDAKNSLWVYEIEKKLRTLSTMIPEELVNCINSLKMSIENFEKQLEQIRKTKTVNQENNSPIV